MANKIIGYLSKYLENDLYFKILIFAALITRLLLFLKEGHPDFDFFEAWAGWIVQYGFTNIYSLQPEKYACDYPPLYLYVLGFGGHLFNWLGLDIHSHSFQNFLRGITLLTEVGFIYYVWRITYNRIFIFFLLFNPVTLINAYAWGQVDLIYTALIFCGFFYIYKNKLYLAAIFFGISLALKTQTLLFLPLTGAFFITKKSGINDKIFSVVIFAVVYLIPNIPFILWSPDPLSSFYPHISASGRYDYLSYNAYNIWWALWSGFQISPSNSELIFGLINRKMFAFILSGIIYAIVIHIVLTEKVNLNQQMGIISFFILSYFIFLPEMHERYLYPFFFFSAFIISFYNKELFYFIVLNIFHSLNMILVWGNKKFFNYIYFSYISRAIAFITFIIWVFYLIDTLKRVYTSRMEQVNPVIN